MSLYQLRKNRQSSPDARFRRGRRVGLAVSTALAMIASAACGGSNGGDSADAADVAAAQAWVEENIPEFPSELVEQACSEGVLSLYALIPPGIQKVNEAFQEDIPCVSVEAFQASGGALAERFTQEQQSGKNMADVIQNFSVAFLDEAAAKGFLENHTPPNASNVPEQWTHPGLRIR